jgi:hypothetical protein
MIELSLISQLQLQIVRCRVTYCLLIFIDDPLLTHTTQGHYHKTNPPFTHQEKRTLR